MENTSTEEARRKCSAWKPHHRYTRHIRTGAGRERTGEGGGVRVSTMIRALYVVLWALGLVPLTYGWRANRVTTLGHAVAWSAAAWTAWGVALFVADADQLGPEPARYTALCLTAAAGVAVLGARRPQVMAWDFVVLGLLAVMLLPLLESIFIGTDPVDPLRVFFLGATLGVGLLNYVPTRSAPAVMLLALAEAGEGASLFAPGVMPANGIVQLFHLLLLLTPWGVWGCWRGGWRGRSEFDRLWLDFRDRLGLLWSQRVREQFNRAAANAGWPVSLAWRGLRRTATGPAISPAEQHAALDTLRAALTRFSAGPTDGPTDGTA